VKLIDVYPHEVEADPIMSGYQLPIAMDIFRGRYCETLAEVRPIQAARRSAMNIHCPTPATHFDRATAL